MAVGRVRDIDWPSWRAVDPATLVFIVKDYRVLLIRKKRGLGAGKVNGPGGRLESGETFKACAIREVQEELHVTPVHPTKVGQHAFQFVDGYSIFVHVYRASNLIGNPEETEEAVPFWCDIDAIPYEEMWEDDRYWLPFVLDKQQFSGRWIFDGDAMLDYELDTVS